MLTLPGDLRERLKKYAQDHVLAAWERLNDPARQSLLKQLQSIDFEQLQQLYAKRDQPFTPPAEEKIKPAPVIPDLPDPAARARGEAALRRGEVAVLLVAGGQASRLGCDYPKGMFPIGPVSNKTLFQIHTEKVLALRRRFGKPIPLLIMTSPATHEETIRFFADQNRFGLPADDVYFFVQGTMPALDIDTGKVIFEAPGRLFMSPNGHGGALTALSDSGLLDTLKSKGITQVFYFQVDNPLVKVADPVFLGHHLLADAQNSSKVIPKDSPTDRLGNIVLIDGCCTIIEYSDLPESLAKQTDAHGRLRIWAGSPAIHVFSVAFLEQVTRGKTRIPFHIARKKVPYLDEAGNLVQPTKENALKFEMFIFDVLPLAERWTVMETSRRSEFAPLKNDTGTDSPELVRQAISDLAGDWLQQAGVAVPRRADGYVAVPLEISPLFALDAEELRSKIGPGFHIESATYLH